MQCWTGRTGSTDHGGDNGPRSNHHERAYDDRGGTNHHGTSNHHGTHDNGPDGNHHYGPDNNHDRHP